MSASQFVGPSTSSRVESKRDSAWKRNDDEDRDVAWVGNFTLRRTAILERPGPSAEQGGWVGGRDPPACDRWLGSTSRCRRRVELRDCRRRARTTKLSLAGSSDWSGADDARHSATAQL